MNLEKMKLKFRFCSQYGRKLLYPCDEKTTLLLSAFKNPSPVCISGRQYEILKKFGFEIEIEQETIEQKLDLKEKEISHD